MLAFSCKNHEKSNHSETTVRFKNVHIIDIENRQILYDQIIDIQNQVYYHGFITRSEAEKRVPIYVLGRM